MAKTKRTTKTGIESKTNKEKEPSKKIVAKEQKKIATKEIKKISAKEEPKKVATKKVDKIETKTALKLENKKESKEKAVKKTIAKKSAPKKASSKTVNRKNDDKDKKAYYEQMSLGDCIHYMQQMNVQYSYEDYTQLLLDNGDLKALEKDIIAGNNIQDLKLDYKKDGYDADIIFHTLNKVADTMDITAIEFKDIKKQIQQSMKFHLSDNGEVNAEEYLKEFHLCEKILMIGQRKDLHESTQISKELDADIMAFTQHFIDLAYAILPTWLYRDVEFYENFICEYLSQYSDLYIAFEQRVLIDCADLYIMHGNHSHGDDAYGYILRENQIKDYIYYRFASIYIHIDMNKAKAIAQGALEYVDERYVYYPQIIDILNK